MLWNGVYYYREDDNKSCVVINLLCDILLLTGLVHTISIYYHCQSAIARTKNKLYNDTSRHIHLVHNLVRESFDNDVAILDYVKSVWNLLDPLTKALAGSWCKKYQMGVKLKHDVKTFSDGKCSLKWKNLRRGWMGKTSHW